MPKDDWLYVEHMLEMSQKALNAVKNKTKRVYDRDELLRLALIHIVQVIGEAARQISPEFQEQNPQVPWRDIIGMRHRIVHDYLRVDEDMVWQVVTSDLLPLSNELEKMLSKNKPLS